MATKRIAAPTPEPAAQRLPAEMAYAQELAALQAADQGPRPDGWRLSPRSVRRFILGGPAPDGGGPEEGLPPRRPCMAAAPLLSVHAHHPC